MSDEPNGSDTTTEPARKRGRPTGSATKRTRRNFAAELSQLEQHVGTAIRVLSQIDQNDTLTQKLVAIAVSELRGGGA